MKSIILNVKLTKVNQKTHTKDGVWEPATYDEPLAKAHHKIKIDGERDLDPAEVSGSNPYETARKVREENKGILERSMRYQTTI